MQVKHMLVMAVAAIAAATAIALMYTAAATPAVKPCDGFRWGGQGRCWERGDGAAFTVWLRRHGSSPARFRKNYPEQARIFGPRWGTVKPYWQRCVTGPACAKAVIQHVFGARWQYAYAIAGCETGGTYYNRARGAAGERGWFQVHPIHFGWLDEERLWDGRYNAKIAYRMSHGGTSWGPWTCARYV